jgi:hypothetical protein
MLEYYVSEQMKCIKACMYAVNNIAGLVFHALKFYDCEYA